MRATWTPAETLAPAPLGDPSQDAVADAVEALRQPAFRCVNALHLPDFFDQKSQRDIHHRAVQRRSPDAGSKNTSTVWPVSGSTKRSPVLTQPAPGLRVGVRHHGVEELDEGVDSSREAIDPVCGMEVAASEASLHLDVDGERRYFCSEHCRERFAAEHAHHG